MGWLVMSLALLDRYAITKKGAGWVVLAIFGLLWSHNLTAISGAGVLGAWIIFTLIAKWESMPYLRGMVVLYVVGCATSAFFWIPVLLERGYVSLDAFQFNPHMRYQDHFYTVWQLFDGLQPYDFGLSIQPERFTLGIVTWGAVLILGVYTIIRRDGINAVRVNGRDILRPYETFFWVVIALASLFLVLPESQFLWDDIETLQTFVFPARFLNITALALAMLIGAGIRVIRWRGVGVILMALLIVQGWHSTVIDWRDDFPANATPRDYLYYEFETNDLATTSANEFKPRSVPNIPPATGFLVDSLINGTPALRVNPDAYGEGVIFTPIKSTAEGYVLEISSEVPLSLEIFQFYFVGWVATLDNAPLGISASGDFGFIRTDMIPAGTHTLRLMRSMTNPQQIGIIVSIIAVFITGGWMVINKQKPRLDENRVGAQHVASLRPLTLFLMAVIITIPLTIMVMREGVAWVESTPAEAKLAENRRYYLLGDSAFLGYDELWDELAMYLYIPENETINISIIEADWYEPFDEINYHNIQGNQRLIRLIHQYRRESVIYRLEITLWQCTEGNPPDCPREILGIIKMDRKGYRHYRTWFYAE
ncbi:MAG TPA: hypothetical protein PLZ51_01210, partial [Aggregatilineales bacterium]|nr:hypothetical protein [Aggregatilineales bacterium]